MRLLRERAQGISTFVALISDCSPPAIYCVSLTSCVQFALGSGGDVRAPWCHILTMSDDIKRAVDAFLKARRTANKKAAEALGALIVMLERRGYDVKGKSVAEILNILRKPPKKPKADGDKTP